MVKGVTAMKISRGMKYFNIFNVTLLLVSAVVCVYPMYYVLIASISDPTEIMRNSSMLLYPLGFSTAAYKSVFQNSIILSGYANTLFILVVGIGISIILTSFAAYFLSRKNIMLQAPIMFFIVFTMFFSGGLIPFYLTVKELGLDDTLWAVILPSVVNTFNLIILRTGFAQVPTSLEESAYIDGANDFVILFKVIFPLAKASLAVIVLYYAVSYWNSWFNASIFLRDRGLYPLQLVLRDILISNDNSSMSVSGRMGDYEGVAQTIKYAVIMVATLPVLCLYPFLQKYFVKGVMIGAVKE